MLIFQNIIKFFTFKTSGFYFGRILVNLYTPKCWKLCKHCIPKRSSSYCAKLFCDFSFILINCGTFIHFNFAFNLIIFFINSQPPAVPSWTVIVTQRRAVDTSSWLTLITSASWDSFYIFVLVLFSTQTFVNPHYQGSLVPTYIILCVMAAWAYLCAGGSLRNLKLCLTCKDKDFLLANHRPR